MLDLGTRDAVIGPGRLRPLSQTSDLYDRCFEGQEPIRFPSLEEGQTLICGLTRYRDQPEHLFLCEDLADMERLYRAYYGGAWSYIQWYIGPDFAVVTVMNGGSQPDS